MLPRSFIGVGSSLCCTVAFLSCCGFVVDGFAVMRTNSRTTYQQPLPRRTAIPFSSATNCFQRVGALQERKNSPSTIEHPQTDAKKEMKSDEVDDSPKQLLFSFFDRPQLPPPEVEDFSLLLYDVTLLLNLTVSVSFWVTHRFSVPYLGVAVSEGCLLSVCWIVAGLLSGSFLYSAANGHRGSAAEPTTIDAAVGTLALNTFVNAVNVRLLFALVLAVLQHRPVGSGSGEDLLGLELGFGLVLMPVWRLLHGRYVTGRMM